MCTDLKVVRHSIKSLTMYYTLWSKTYIGIVLMNRWWCWTTSLVFLVFFFEPFLPINLCGLVARICYPYFDGCSKHSNQSVLCKHGEKLSFVLKSISLQFKLHTFSECLQFAIWLHMRFVSKCYGAVGECGDCDIFTTLILIILQKKT